jgi:uncharacterized protein YkwD
MKLRPLYKVFFLVCLLTAVAVSTEAAADGNRPDLDLPALEQKIHALVNEERRKQGLSALKWNERLQRAARSHSADMAAGNYFSHVTPGGDAFDSRYEKYGVECRVRSGSRIHTGGENISQDNLFESVTYRKGVPSYNWKTSDEIAESVVRRWMASPGHRKNLLAPHWKTEGIGVAVSQEGKVLVTQNFC